MHPLLQLLGDLYQTLTGLQKRVAELEAALAAKEAETVDSPPEPPVAA